MPDKLNTLNTWLSAKATSAGRFVKGLNPFTKAARSSSVGNPFAAFGSYLMRFSSGISARTLADRLKGWVYVCTERRAKALASLDWTFGHMNEKGEVEPLPPDHWLTQLVQNPTGVGDAGLEWVTWREIIKGIEQSRCYQGVSVLWTPDGTEDGTGAYPVQAFILPASQVRPVNLNNIVDYFEWMTPRGPKRLPRRQVCYMPVLAPNDNVVQGLVTGHSLYDAAADAIAADEATTKFVADFFRNGAMQPMVLEEIGGMDDEWTEEEFRNWARRVQEHQISDGNRVPFGKLPKGITIKVLDLVSNLKGMLGIADKTMEMIAQVWGIPISMLKGNAANFATARVDNYTLRVDTIEPEAYTIEDILTRHFQKYEPGIVVRHVPSIDEDPVEVRNDELHRLQTGQVTTNDLRKANGLAPLSAEEGGDLVLIGPDLKPLVEKIPLGRSNELAKTVGGALEFKNTLKDYKAGLLTREQAIAFAMDFYGKDQAQADAYFPVIEPEPPPEPPPSEPPAEEPPAEPAEDVGEAEAADDVSDDADGEEEEEVTTDATESTDEVQP
jgi:hypothetical protein